MDDYSPERILKRLQDNLVGAVGPQNKSFLDEPDVKCVHIGYPIAIQVGILVLTILLLISMLVSKYQQNSPD